MSYRAKLIVATVGLIAYLASTNLPLTGVFIHEWLCVGIAVLFAVHTAANWDWAKKVLGHFVRKLLSLSRLNATVDIILFTLFFAVMVSGIMESRVVLPTLGIPIPRGMTWRILHSLTAKLLLVAVGIHLGLHWRWIVHATRRFLTPGRPKVSDATTAEVQS